MTRSTARNGIHHETAGGREGRPIHGPRIDAEIGRKAKAEKRGRILANAILTSPRVLTNASDGAYNEQSILRL